MKFDVCPKELLYLEMISNHMSQKQLAMILGTNASNVSMMVHGHKTIGLKMAKKLGEVFNKDYRLFLTVNYVN